MQKIQALDLFKKEAQSASIYNERKNVRGTGLRLF